MIRRARIGWLSRALSAAVVVALVGIAALAGWTLERTHRQATEAARVELETLSDAVHLHDLLYQKGFSSEYMLTGDARWLEELDRTSRAFRDWIAAVRRDARSPHAAEIVDEIATEYALYDAERDRSIATFRAGERERAIETMIANRVHATRLKSLAAELLELRRKEIASELEQRHAAFRRNLAVLGLFVAFAIAFAGTVGFVLARRVGRPLYELVLRAESTAGARVEVHGDDEIATISSHVTRLAREVEISSAKLAEQRARVVQAEKMSMLGEMAASMAHEVLNPLAGIKVALQLLARLEPSPAVRETVAAVDREIARVDALARRLIAFARPITPSARRCELGEIVPRVLGRAKLEAREGMVRFELELKGAATIHADPELLEQLLLNLVLNACQAIDGEGRVLLRARALDGGCAIDVIDDGRGIAAEVAPRLFTPFTTNKPDGHGLGLAFSQSVAVAHGGRIEAHANRPERGSTFTVFLPEPA